MFNSESQRFQQLAHRLHIGNRWHIGEFVCPRAIERGDHQFEYRVLRPRYLNLAR